MYLTNHHTQQFIALHIKYKPYRTRQTPDIRTYIRIQTAANPSIRQPTEHTTTTPTDTNRQPTNTCPLKSIYKHDINTSPYTQHHNTIDYTHPSTTHLLAMSTLPDDQRPSTSRRSVKRFKRGGTKLNSVIEHARPYPNYSARQSTRKPTRTQTQSPAPLAATIRPPYTPDNTPHSSS